MKRFVLALVAALALVAPVGAVNLSDPAITESSWLALSPHDPGLLFTGNDEPGPFFGVDSATGKTAGKNVLAKTTLVDPESADFAPNTGFWLADLGDNNATRKSFVLYAMADPGRGNHTITPEKYPVRYGDGRSHNAEAFFIKPTTGNRYIITKEASGLLFRNDVGTLDQGTVGTFRAVGSNLPAYVTEAKFTPDARFVLARQKGQPDTVTVLDGEWFKTLGRFSVPKVNQPESLATDGNFVWLGSEGSNSPLVKAPVPAAYGGEPDSDPTPATGLDLNGWKLTLPVGAKSKPTEVFPIGDFTYTPWFDRQPDRLVFRANAGGVTTSGSGYPRSELREMAGSKLAAWSNTSGTHTMTITQAITHLPVKKPHVVAGQIHDAEDDVAMVRLEGKRLFVEAGGKEVGVLDADYRLGAKFTVEFKATKAGVTVTYNDAKSVHLAKTGSGWYFKAGCYTQSNVSKGDKADAYGEVVIYALTVDH